MQLHIFPHTNIKAIYFPYCTFQAGKCFIIYARYITSSFFIHLITIMDKKSRYQAPDFIESAVTPLKSIHFKSFFLKWVIGSLIWLKIWIKPIYRASYWPKCLKFNLNFTDYSTANPNCQQLLKLSVSFHLLFFF